MTCAGRLARLLEVALLAPLHTDLSEEHGGEETNVPGDHVEPELVLEAGALGEVGEVLADGVREGGCREGRSHFSPTIRTQKRESTTRERILWRMIFYSSIVSLMRSAKECVEAPQLPRWHVTDTTDPCEDGKGY